MFWKSKKDKTAPEPQEDTQVNVVEEAPVDVSTDEPAVSHVAEPAVPSDDSDNGQDAGAHDEIIAAIRTVYDPEIPVNVYDIGLIYDINVDPSNDVQINMTLTSPNCPEAEIIPVKVEKAVESVGGINRCKVAIVWDPPWTPDQLSEAAKLELGML